MPTECANDPGPSGAVRTACRYVASSLANAVRIVDQTHDHRAKQRRPEPIDVEPKVKPIHRDSSTPDAPFKRILF